MANYTLTLDLQGGEKVESGIDSITKKVSAFKLASSSVTSLKIGIKDIARAFEDAAKAAQKMAVASKIGFDKNYVPKIIGAAGAPTMDSHVADYYNHLNEKLTESFNGRKLTGAPFADIGNDPQDREARIKKEAIEARRKDLIEADAKRAVSDRAKFYKDMTFLMMPAMNPGSVWATLFSTRQTFSAFTQSEMGRSMTGGSLGKAAGITALLVGASTAVGVALMGLKKMVEGATAAIHTAFGLYTGAAQQGLSTSFYTQRNVLANVLGVSGNPNQVFMFGKAVQYVSDRTKYATMILSTSARPLAELEIQSRILKTDLSALFASMALNAAPAIEDLTIALQKLTTAATFFSRLNIQMIPGLSEADKLFRYVFKIPSESKIPALFGGMKQLPASSWEKMGLVIGGGMADYPRRTAKGIERLVQIAEKNYGVIAQRNVFGLAPGVAHP